MDSLNWSIRQYNQWCLDRIHGYDTAYADYHKLLDLLNSIPYFYHSYPNGTDEDRYRDGLALRSEYAEQTGDFGITHYDADCSVLEMLIALARRIDWGLMGIPTEDRTYWWFWLFIKNLKLNKMTDANFDEFYIYPKVDDWLNRNIKPNGEGGLFPLHNPNTDQRNESTWHQLNFYIIENYLT